MGKRTDQIEVHEMWQADEHDDGEIFVYDDKLQMDVCIATEMPTEHRDRAIACVNALAEIMHPEMIPAMLDVCKKVWDMGCGDGNPECDGFYGRLAAALGDCGIRRRRKK